VERISKLSIWLLISVLIFSVLIVIFFKNRGASDLETLLFSASTTTILFLCYFYARHIYYSYRLPLGSLPFLLMFFWPIFSVVYPTFYIAGSPTYENQLNYYFALNQLLCLVITVFVILGIHLSERVFKKKSIDLVETYSSKLLGVGTIIFSFSLLKLLEQLQRGALGRGSFYRQVTKTRWIYDNLGAFSMLAFSVIFIYFFYYEKSQEKRKKGFILFIVFSLISILTRILSFEYVMLLIQVYFAFVGIVTYDRKYFKPLLIAVLLSASVVVPIMNVVRTSFATKVHGVEAIRSLGVSDIREFAREAYLERNERNNELSRMGDTMVFTAETLKVIPSNADYFYGRLLLSEIKYIVPYILWSGKYSPDNPMRSPEEQIELVVRGTDADTGFGPLVFFWSELGIVGIVSGILVFGFLIGAAYWLFAYNSISNIGLVMYSMFAVAVTRLEESWTMNILLSLRLAVMFFVVYLIFKVLQKICLTVLRTNPR